MSFQQFARRSCPFILTVIAACGGGGGPSPVQRQLPELAVAFPSSGSVATSAQITVRGTVSEPV
ncbi:MAG: hypothetical protein AB7O84_16980, partial [Planctomycetota bacterium]